MAIKLSDGWVPIALSGLVSLSVFIGMSRDHVTEAQAMKISRQEVVDRAFPLADGKVMVSDIANIREDIKEIKIYVKYLSGLIEKDELKKELGELSDDTVEKKMNLSMNMCSERYPEIPGGAVECANMLYACHYRSYSIN